MAQDYDRSTDRQTDRPRKSVCKNRLIYIVVSCGLTISFAIL